MFEPNMDEYLDEEIEWIKRILEGICKSWEQQLGSHPAAPTFLSASNPDQVKRNVLAGFKDALLLPVTIVPRTVTFGVNAIVTGGSHGLSMLNPQKWTGPVVREELPISQKNIQTSQAENTSEDIKTAAKESDTTAFDSLQMLVSLDTALELIQADRDSLKRVETFARYPGKCGSHVRDAIEEIFILMLKSAGDRHIAPGFRL
jgi:recyclin-1